MNLQLLRGSIAIVAVLAISAAFGSPAKAPNYTHVRVTHLPDNFDSCHAKEAKLSAKTDNPNINLTISADGALEKFDLPEKSPDWMKELAGCALAGFRFSPATLDAVPVEGSGFLQFKLRARGSGQPLGVEIERIGPLVTPPRMWRTGGSTDACYRINSSRAAAISHFTVELIVRRDGSVTIVQLPIGSESWHEELVRCVLDRLAFTPGTVDGSPVDAETTLPIVRHDSQGKVNAPKLRSTDEELEAAYRACYPPDQFAIGSAAYNFTITTSGRVISPTIMKSTGDPLLDEAGTCILMLLEFTPLKQNGRNIRSKSTLELSIRPPR